MIFQFSGILEIMISAMHLKDCKTEVLFKLFTKSVPHELKQKTKISDAFFGREW